MPRGIHPRPQGRLGRRASPFFLLSPYTPSLWALRPRQVEPSRGSRVLSRSMGGPFERAMPSICGCVDHEATGPVGALRVVTLAQKMGLMKKCRKPAVDDCSTRKISFYLFLSFGWHLATSVSPPPRKSTLQRARVQNEPTMYFESTIRGMGIRGMGGPAEVSLVSRCQCECQMNLGKRINYGDKREEDGDDIKRGSLSMFSYSD